MPVYSIARDALTNGQPLTLEQARQWCAQLEAGSVLYFPESPVPLATEDLNFLLGLCQSSGRFHKNIAYKPARDRLSGAGAKIGARAPTEQLRAVMRRYSASVAVYLAGFLGPYERRWILDYASFRPIEERGRDATLRRRNDLLHTDAFPTRPTRGRRILRFFHNIHPTRTRDWLVGEPFSRILGEFSPGKLPLPRPDGSFKRVGKRLANALGLGKFVPQCKRTPYDEFMVQLHNAMKEDEQFQLRCATERIQFAPGSSWMVYTDTAPHAVLAGQFALEQTMLVDPEAMVSPDSAPLAVLEKIAGASLI
jgi:hypothetical protein